MGNTRSKNPTVAGMLSGVVPGLGQFYCRQWAKGVGFLVSAVAVDVAFGVSSGILQLLQSFGASVQPDATGQLLLGSFLFLAIAIWSITDAVRAAKHLSP